MNAKLLIQILFVALFKNVYSQQKIIIPETLSGNNIELILD